MQMRVHHLGKAFLRAGLPQGASNQGDGLIGVNAVAGVNQRSAAATPVKQYIVRRQPAALEDPQSGKLDV
jgi:hypothetical protein